VSISPKQDLSGQIDVAIKRTSALVSTPPSLSGTVSNPSLYRSKAALVGTAAGTVLLPGPGLGTTVGMKAARMTRKLLGGKPDSNKQKAEPAKAEATRQTSERAAAEKKRPSAAHTGR